MSVDLMEMWHTMGWFAKAIVWLLFIMSLMTMTVAIQRYWDLIQSKKQTVRFAPLLAAALDGNNLDAAEKAVQECKRGHLASSYRGVFTVLKENGASRTLGATEVGSIARTIDLNKLEQLARFRRGMGMIATTGATAPFVGLLGTTMGVVNAFSGMATAGSGGLAAISAGISEALIATAFGLLVAIPAVWLYNYFTAKIDDITNDIQVSIQEFLDWCEKRLLPPFEGEALFASMGSDTEKQVQDLED